MNVTTAVERALLAQAGLALTGHDFTDLGEVEIWTVSDQVDLAIHAIEAHFILGIEDEAESFPTVAAALANLRVRRAVGNATRWGAPLQ